MLVEQGNVKELSGPWYAVQLTTDYNNDIRFEEAVLTIIRWAAKRQHAFQLVFPVNHRGVDGVTLLSPYIWIRARNLSGIGSAINPRRTKADFVRDASGNVISVEDSFVQEVIKHCKTIADSWSAGISVGNFVRVLYGTNRMFCGRVTKESKGIAQVDITLRSRHINLTVPVVALENLGKDQREYFYTGV